MFDSTQPASNKCAKIHSQVVMLVRACPQIERAPEAGEFCGDEPETSDRSRLVPRVFQLLVSPVRLGPSRRCLPSSVRWAHQVSLDVSTLPRGRYTESAMTQDNNGAE